MKGMKKLLLIALTIPNFVLADDFKLVCEGEESNYRNDVLENTSKTSLTLQVRDDSIVIDSMTYKSKTFDYGAYQRLIEIYQRRCPGYFRNYSS
jgi:hypothetical protein